MLWVFILPPGEGLFVINFIPFTQGVGMVLFVMKNDFPAVYPSGSK